MQLEVLDTEEARESMRSGVCVQVWAGFLLASLSCWVIFGKSHKPFLTAFPYLLKGDEDIFSDLLTGMLYK